MIKNYKKIFFVGIGGIGMSSMAELLYNLGYDISGSDLIESDRTKHLNSIGIKIYIGHKESNIQGMELLVYSSAVKKDNLELVKANKLNIPILRRAEMLGEIIKSKDTSIAISGTHGKTTTSSMLGVILNDAKLKPTVVIGGIVINFKGNSILGTGKSIIVEADEFDKTFLSLKPSMGIINNIELEHVDCYSNIEELKNSFITFINSTSPNKKNALCIDDENINSILKKIKNPYTTYGFSKNAEIQARNERHNGNISKYELWINNKFNCLIKLSVPGNHNILNSLGAITIALEMGVDINIIKESLKSFKGVKRRFEVRFKTENNIIIVNDYAHHPSEIRETIKTAKKSYKNKNIIAVFQPHLFTRTKTFHKEFSKELSLADKIILTDIYPSREKPIEGITAKTISENFNNKIDYYYEPNMYDIPKILKKICKNNDMILLMGAGDIFNITNDIYKEVK